MSSAGTASSRQADPFTPTGCDRVPFAPRLEATVAHTRRPSLQTRFAGIPDVPLERFELTFDAKRSLIAQKDFCRGPQPLIVAELTGHNGAVARLSEPLNVAGCATPAVTLSVRGRRLTLRVAAVRGRPLSRLRLTQRVAIHGRLSHRLRKRRAFVVEALDSSGRELRRRLRRAGR